MENSGNKLKDFAAEKGLIIGGEDTCQGDSGGPLWVEEEGKVELTSSDISLISPSPGNTGRTGQQRPRLRIPELSRHLHEVRAEVSEVT